VGLDVVVLEAVLEARPPRDVPDPLADDLTPLAARLARQHPTPGVGELRDVQHGPGAVPGGIPLVWSTGGRVLVQVAPDRHDALVLVVIEHAVQLVDRREQGGLAPGVLLVAREGHGGHTDHQTKIIF
jgi:hypothetical protein